ALSRPSHAERETQAIGVPAYGLLEVLNRNGDVVDPEDEVFEGPFPDSWCMVWFNSMLSREMGLSFGTSGFAVSVKDAINRLRWSQPWTTPPTALHRP